MPSIKINDRSEPTYDNIEWLRDRTERLTELLKAAAFLRQHGLHEAVLTKASEAAEDLVADICKMAGAVSQGRENELDAISLRWLAEWTRGDGRTVIIDPSADGEFVRVRLCWLDAAGTPCESRAEGDIRSAIKLARADLPSGVRSL